MCEEVKEWRGGDVEKWRGGEVSHEDAEGSSN